MPHPVRLGVGASACPERSRRAPTFTAEQDRALAPEEALLIGLTHSTLHTLPHAPTPHTPQPRLVLPRALAIAPSSATKPLLSLGVKASSMAATSAWISVFPHAQLGSCPTNPSVRHLLRYTRARRLASPLAHASVTRTGIILSAIMPCLRLLRNSRAHSIRLTSYLIYPVPRAGANAIRQSRRG